MSLGRPIMLVDDDPADITTVQHVLEDLSVTNELLTACDDEVALEALELTGELPCIIMLRADMPTTDGLAFMRRLQGSRRLRHIPVIILTSDACERQRYDGIDHAIAGYVNTPVSYRELADLMRTLYLYESLSRVSAVDTAA